MRQAGMDKIRFRKWENLCFILQASERVGEDDPVIVLFEYAPAFMFLTSSCLFLPDPGGANQFLPLHDLVPFLFLRRFCATTIEGHDANYKTGIVPSAIVIDSIYSHFILEQGNDKSKQGNKTMEQAPPETQGFFRQTGVQVDRFRAA